MKIVLTAAEVVRGTHEPLVYIAWEEQNDTNVTLASGRIYLPRAAAEEAFRRLFDGVETEVRVERVYRVVEGDVLSDIAARFGCRLNALVHLNSIVDPGHLRVGQRLRLPEATR